MNNGLRKSATTREEEYCVTRDGNIRLHPLRCDEIACTPSARRLETMAVSAACSIGLAVLSHSWIARLALVAICTGAAVLGLSSYYLHGKLKEDARSKVTWCFRAAIILIAAGLLTLALRTR